MFDRKTLAGKCSTNTMDRRGKTIAGNSYAQVFANEKYFAKLFPAIVLPLLSKVLVDHFQLMFSDQTFSLTNSVGIMGE